MKRGARGAGRGGRAGSAAARAAADGDGNEGPRSTPGASTTGRAQSTTPGRAPSTSRASRGASSAPGRFRPKNVRRDEAERDTIARQEEKKASDRAADERRARGRSRFRSKRSRGDAMGARGGSRVTGGGSGPFSSGVAGPSSKIGGSWGGAGGGSGGFGAGFGASRTKGERGAPGFGVARDHGPRETRINADRLHAKEPEQELDSEDEAMMTALTSRTNVLPMGIYRREHKETGVVVATTAELEAAENAGEEESLWVDDGSPDDQEIPEQPAEEGVWETGGSKPAVVKQEPEADTDATMDVDSIPEKAPVAKEDTQKVEIKVKKVPPQDPEDRVIQADLELLASELGAVTVTENGETRTEGPTDKDGRMYLFQFPPLLPPLKPGDQTPQPMDQVKAEPGEFDMADAPPPAAHGGTPVDLTEGDGGIDLGDGNEDGESPSFMSSMLTEGGMVGKLNVRKSGKVELDWGGRILELSPATAMNFLTTAVIVEENDEKPAPGVIGGESTGMGKIMGRFTLAPVWGEEEDWDVPPEELDIGQTADT